MKLKEFFFGKDDWKLVWSETGAFTKTGLISGTVTQETCWYKIYFSSSRNKYRLKVGGFHPRGNSVYQTAVDQLNHFESQL